MDANEFTEVREAFDAWLSESKLEDLKHVRYCLLGIVVIQLVAWTPNEPIECGIPINRWLITFCFMLIIDVVLHVKRIFLIDHYFNRILANPGMPYDQARTLIKVLIHSLKMLARF